MRYFVFGCFVALLAMSAAADIPCTDVKGAVLFIDAREFVNGTSPNAAFFADAADSNAAAIVALVKAGDLDAAAGAIPKGNPTADTTRWFGTKGATIMAATFRMDNVDLAVKFKEEPRKSRIASDFETLKKLAAAENVLENRKTVCDVTVHTLKEVRAILSTTVTGTVDDKEKTETVAAITTGPPEYVFLSADIPVTSTKQLKFDTENKTVAPKDTPKDFMLGFDLQLGDVLTAYPAVDWHRVVFSPMVKFSKKPDDNLGATVGYRWNNMIFFGGHFWTKEDIKTGTNPTTGADTFRTHRKGHWEAGVGYNLDAALNWVKKQ